VPDFACVGSMCSKVRLGEPIDKRLFLLRYSEIAKIGWKPRLLNVAFAWDNNLLI